MGQMVVGLAGAAIGNLIAPGIGGSIGFMAGSMLGSFLFPVKGPKMPDINVSSSAWGAGIPILYGTSRIAGALIWSDKGYWDNVSGGKGGGGGKGAQPTAHITFAMGFCEGPVDAVLQIYADALLIYDVTGTGPVTNGYNFNIYLGGEDQQPDSSMAYWVQNNITESPTSCPAYRGLCYIVFYQMDLTSFGSRIPSISIVVSKTNSGTTPVKAFVSGPETTNQGRGIYADLEKGIVYSIDAIEPNLLHSWNAATLTELNNVSMDTILPKHTSDGSDVIPTIFSCTQGGDIFVTGSSPSNSEPIWKINADSFTYGGVYGTESSGLAGTLSTGNVPYTEWLMGAMGQNGEQVVILRALQVFGGGVGVLNGDDMTYMWGDPTLPDYVHFALGHWRCVQASPGILWFLAYDGSNSVYIYRGQIGAGYTFSMTQYDVLPAEGVPGMDGGAGFNLTSVYFDSTDDTIIFVHNQGGTGGGTWMIKYDPATKTALWNVAVSSLIPPDSIASLTRGTIGLPSGGSGGQQVTVYSTRDGSVLQVGTMAGTTYSSTAEYWMYDSILNAAIVNNPQVIYAIFFQRNAPASNQVAAAVADVCSRCGLADSQVDVSGITANVDGYVISRNSAGKDIIAQLAQAFFFDGVESNGVLKFTQRGGAPIATLTQDDLASPNKSEDGNYWVHTRTQQQEIPVQVNIKFKDTNNRYQDNVAYAKRIQAPIAAESARKKLDVELPMCMTLDDATSMAQTWLYTIWMERDAWQTKTGQQYLHLDPADVVTVNMDDGSSYNVRIKDNQIGADYSIKFTMEGEDGTTYSLQQTGLATTSPYDQTISLPTKSRLLALNIPLLVDTDDTGGVGSRAYYGAGGYSHGFSVSQLFFSFDGTDYFAFDQIGSSTTWGTVINTVGTTANPDTTDNINTIQLVPINLGATIQSDSQLNVLNGTNMALVGQEIIQWQTATVNGDGSYTLSKLFRGRRGSDWAVGTHVAGETFVLLDTNVHSKVIAIANVNTPFSAKLVPSNSTLADTSAVTVTFKGYDLKPYSPVHFTTEMSGSDLRLDFIRRTRIAGGLNDGTGIVPLGEAHELFDVYFMATPYDPVANNYGAPATYTRYISNLNQTYYIYTAAEMTADSFNPATTPLNVVIFQRSSLIGIGWPGYQTIPVPA